MEQVEKGGGKKRERGKVKYRCLLLRELRRGEDGERVYERGMRGYREGETEWKVQRERGNANE